ncbi:MAG: hypothetical protein RR643_05120 [Anaerorhabdus sp.]|uniref:hypothetical protein n=1 Tax=Anaerorhabdus sp. TaxID=1872524 RepID=UPI002FC5E77F
MVGRLQWDLIGERLYETGTSHGVLFVQDKTGAYKPGVAWNGLTGIKQSPDGAESTDQYADNDKYLSLTSKENFKGTIEAFTYPDEFNACDGSAEIVPGVTVGQQNRSQFGISYETVIGNDTVGEDFGTKLHIIYGAKTAPSAKEYATINDSPEALALSWEFSTTPATAPDGFKPTAYICLNSTTVAPEIYNAVRDKIQGSATTESSLPSLVELITMIKGVTTTTTTSTTTTTTTKG